MGGEVGAHSGFQRQLSKLHSSSGFLHANSLIYLELRTLDPTRGPGGRFRASFITTDL